MTTLTEYLITGNHIGPGMRRRARMRVCGGCKVLILGGYDDVVCAFPRRADPWPLNATGEAAALLEGRWTVSLLREGSGFVLDPRWPQHIEAKPAGATRRQDVLREHRCGSPPPSEALLAPSTFALIAHHLPPGSPAPF